MAASGMSLKKMAKTLNDRNVMSPRPGSKKKYDTWCPTAIRDMMRREIYVGRVIWNKSKWLKKPGTNKRVRRARPESDWKIIERPDLRIITDECWAAVQQKIAYTMEKYSNGAWKGLANRIQTSPYMLSGFLKCNDCGAHLVIVSGRGGKWARYGCTQHWNCGACKNDLTIRRSDVESEFLKELEAFSTLEYVTNFVFDEFVKQLRENLDSGDNSVTRLKRRKEHVEAEIETLLDALAKGVPAASLKKRIAAREKELEEVKAQLKNNKQEQFEFQLAELRKLVQGQIFSVRSLIAKQKENAKYELSKTVKEIWMVPSKNAEGERFYFGIGKWDLLGGLAPLLSRFFELLEFLAVLRIRSVASQNTSSNTSPRIELREAGHLIDQRELAGSRINASGAKLYTGVENVAGGGFEPPTFGL